MQILRAANYKVMPWKNGLGSTTEIAVSPGAQGLDGFDWRISMARVAADGPFSPFPGIDRTLLVLEGDGIILSVASHPLVRLDRDAIHAFPGDQSTYATLVGGPIVDLNIMTRRERFRHAVRRVDLAGAKTWDAPTVLTVVFVERGAITLQAGAVSEVLEERDAILLDAQSPTLRMEAAAPARLVAIEFQPLQPA
jgi:environmental stress-induced protein Ves